ncbi:MAG TPA: thioredoxin family protein [Candidatus Hydrogenedens sp.]|nr:thioredoxin family protein [Candidatus Hydrogenedens sp.]HOK09720.1 thioredoxin family protein [Candidatus Hydrogenedens sp.]HOL19309.1 thioredoxin family protein [Candidatus Hydrogenedens sp.]HPP59262.1 thioredoxin family protein [Candidatus Hydrogenedens sp.]
MKEIKVLGPGCMKCVQLYNNAKTAVDELKMECDIEKVSDIQKIMDYGVMMTPALVVDGEVKTAGKVPSVEEIKKILAS